MGADTSRDKTIIKTSIIGVLVNVFLAAFKAGVGLMSNSIAIVMDAVNNLSDASSSVITIVGTKLAGREADRKHPFGYGRIEYLSAMVISILVLYAGITALVESIKKIVTPDVPDYSAVTLIVVAVAVVVKIVLGRYVKHVGKKVNSDSLVNSGEDATLDSVISASTLVAAGIYLFFNISLEAWLGAIIALVIIKSGLGMMAETLSKILGERADDKFAKAIKKTIASHPGVNGAYDLVLHNYGPDTYNGSVHIEVPDTLATDELDKLTRKITMDVLHEHNVILTAIGVYAFNTKDTDAAAAREKVYALAKENPYVLQTHGFYIDKEEKTIRLDAVVSFEAKERSKVQDDIQNRIKSEYPDYDVHVSMDIDFSESSTPEKG